MKTDHILLLGAHMSVSGGYYKAFERAESIGCTAMQIFTKSNRQWAAKDISEQEAEKFREANKLSSVKAVISHASYLINIGSPNQEINKKSADALVDELKRCDILGIPSLVLHPGSRQDSSEKECLDLIATNINKIFAASNTKSTILLENMAGMGSSIAHTFEQLAYIIDNVEDKKRIGACIDTCHAFAAGYNFNTKEEYENMINQFDKFIGLKLLKAMHINDSKKDIGSRLDRHEFILKGKINKEAFELIFNDPRLFDVPKILETPIENDPKEYIPDIKTIVNLLSKENHKLLKGLKLEEYL